MLDFRIPGQIEYRNLKVRRISFIGLQLEEPMSYHCTKLWALLRVPVAF